MDGVIVATVLVIGMSALASVIKKLYTKSEQQQERIYKEIRVISNSYRNGGSIPKWYRDLDRNGSDGTFAVDEEYFNFADDKDRLEDLWKDIVEHLTWIYRDDEQVHIDFYLKGEGKQVDCGWYQKSGGLGTAVLHGRGKYHNVVRNFSKYYPLHEIQRATEEDVVE